MFDRLSEDQRQVLNIVREGHNIFITGQGGTAGEGGFGQVMYRSLERSPQNSRDGIFFVQCPGLIFLAACWSGPAASASIFSVVRVGHTLLASIVLTFSGRCDEVFDGNNAGDIRHYCGNCYKCFSVEDFASCKCCRYIRSLSTLPF